MPRLEELTGCVSLFYPNDETKYAATPRMLHWLATQSSLARLSITLQKLDAVPNGINVQNETPSQQYFYYNTDMPKVSTKPPPIDLTAAEVFCPALEELETHSPTPSDLSKFLELSTASYIRVLRANVEEVKLEDVHDLFGSLLNHIDLSYLTHLVVMKDLQKHDSLPCRLLQASRLRPLFAVPI